MKKTILAAMVMTIAFIMGANCIYGAPTGVAARTADAPADTTARELEEVEVTAANTRRVGNVDVHTVTKSLRAGCRNAGEMLGKIEGITRDSFSKAITYIGSKNIIVLVDSVPRDWSYIQKLSPGRFDRITVTNFPTGEYEKYDAVINLHTKPDYVGYEGGAEAGVELFTGGRNGAGNPMRTLGTSIDFTYTKNKLNLSVKADFNRKSFGYGFYEDKVYPVNGYQETAVYQPLNKPTSRQFTAYPKIELSADYNITDKHSVSVLWNITPSFFKTRNHDILVCGPLSMPGDTVVSNSNNDIKNQLNNSVGFYYRGKYGLWNLNANIAYNNLNYDRILRVNRSDGYSLYDPRSYKYDMVWGGVTLSRSSKNGKWWFYAWDVLNYTDYDAHRPDHGALLAESSNIVNTTNLSASYYPSNKLAMGANVGVNVNSERNMGRSKTYVRPRAGAWISYYPRAHQWIRLNFSTYAQCPGMSLMYDYGSFTDSLTYSVGNPNLKPGQHYDVSLMLSLLENLFLRASYSHIADNFSYMAFLGTQTDAEPHHFASYTYMNGKMDDWDLSLSYQRPFCRYFYLTAEAGAHRQSASSLEWKNHSTGPHGYCSVQYQNRLATFMAMYSINYSLVVSPQWHGTVPGDGFRVGFMRNFLHDRLQVQFAYSPPVHFVKGMKTWMNSDAVNIYRYSNDYKRTDNQFTVAVEYRFSGGKSVRKYEYDQRGINK